MRIQKSEHRIRLLSDGLDHHGVSGLVILGVRNVQEILHILAEVDDVNRKEEEQLESTYKTGLKCWHDILMSSVNLCSNFSVRIRRLRRA
jgi:hypothetical protein